MRNLLGRLNARSPEELGRIAAAWNVPISGGDKLGQVAQLYRTLTDPRAVRDMWDQLPDDEQALISIFALGDEEPRPLAELATVLGRPEAEVRQTAVRLYGKGLLAREGDGDPIPVGSAPRLLMPRELSQHVQRVKDEIDAGDTSNTPLKTSLSLLDDRDIEEAAEAWGVRVIPGLRSRDELSRSLLNQLGEPHRLAELERSLSKEARKLWEWLQSNPDGKPAPLADGLAAAGLSLDDPRAAARTRQTLGMLETSVLVWHTYRAGGSRWLYIPAEIRAPRSSATAAPDLPAPVAAPATEAAPRTSDPVAWDLLTLLRALSPPQRQRVHAFRDAPRPWLRHVNAGLWNRGAELPPEGYLEFLIELARIEGLIVGGDAAVEEAFQVNPIVRVWRDRSFTEQTDRLRAAWLGSAAWLEADERDDVEVWGADWPGFRFKLLAHLGQLAPGSVYPLDEVVQWLARRDPDMLGSTSQVATARNTEIVADVAASRAAALAEVIAVTLTTGFTWFGLVEVIAPERAAQLLLWTEAGAEVAHGTERPVPPDMSGPPVLVADDGEIRIPTPTPLRIWSISAFADLVELALICRFQLNEDSISRALRAGFEIQQIERFLSGQTGKPISATLVARIQSWSQEVQRVRIGRVLRLVPDDAEQLDALIGLIERAGYQAERVGDSLLVAIEEAAELSSVETALLGKLRNAGFTPQGPPTPRPGPRRPPEPKSRRSS